MPVPSDFGELRNMVPMGIVKVIIARFSIGTRKAAFDTAPKPPVTLLNVAKSIGIPFPIPESIAR